MIIKYQSQINIALTINLNNQCVKIKYLCLEIIPHQKYIDSLPEV